MCQSPRCKGFKVGVFRISPIDRSSSKRAGRGSSISCASAGYADARGFDPHVRQHSFVEIGHEIVSTAFSPFR